MLPTKFGDHPLISSVVEDVLRFFYFLALLTPKRGQWHDMSKFKCGCHKDATDQILGKSAQQFQRRRGCWRMMTDEGVSPFDTNSSPWAFGSGVLIKEPCCIVIYRLFSLYYTGFIKAPSQCEECLLAISKYQVHNWKHVSFTIKDYIKHYNTISK
jgi:hypothetical protein